MKQIYVLLEANHNPGPLKCGGPLSAGGEGIECFPARCASFTDHYYPLKGPLIFGNLFD